MRVMARVGCALTRGGVRRSRGASSVEYGLLIALIGGALCLGIGLSLRSVLQETVCSLMSQVSSSDCGGTGTGIPGTGDGSGLPTGGGGPAPTVSASPSVTPTPTTTPTTPTP